MMLKIAKLLSHPRDFPGKRTGVGAIAFSVIAVTLWLFSLPPPLPHQNGFSKSPARRPIQPFLSGLSDLALTSLPTTTSTSYLKVTRACLLSQDLHLPFLLLMVRSQVLCCQVNTKYDFNPKLFLRNTVKLHIFSLSITSLIFSLWTYHI